MSRRAGDLAGVEVRVLFASLDQPPSVAAALAGLCDDTERTGAGRLRRASLRQDRLVARGLLRVALGQLLDTAPGAVAIDRRSGLPPRLAEQDGAAAGVRFSLAHSGRLVAVAVARGAELGIDVERLDPTLEVETVARRTFTAGEQEALRAASPRDRRPLFFRIWTRKEAFLKARGVGWALTPDRHPDLSLPAVVDGCHVADIPVAAGYAAAVATIPLSPVGGPFGGAVGGPVGGPSSGRRTTIHPTTIGVP